MRTFLFFKIFFKKVLSENFGSWPPLKFWSHDAPGSDVVREEDKKLDREGGEHEKNSSEKLSTHDFAKSFEL